MQLHIKSNSFTLPDNKKKRKFIFIFHRGASNTAVSSVKQTVTTKEQNIQNTENTGHYRKVLTFIHHVVNFVNQQ